MQLTGMRFHGLAIHFLLVVQVAEAIQCRGMHNRLADSIQVMANLLHPVCIAVQWCQQSVFSTDFLSWQGGCLLWANMPGAECVAETGAV